MQINFESERPIFLQVADGIEDGILAGAYGEEAQIPSITEFSTTYKINPATALKGINLLVDAGIVYKKRGLGMFVSKGAVDQLKTARKERFFEDFVKEMIMEARRLGLDLTDIQSMIERGYDDERN